MAEQQFFEYKGKQYESLSKLQQDMVIRTVEDLRQAILDDELQDAHDMAQQGTAKMSVREYAKFKKESPQLLYYYIRQGYIDEEPCDSCGRNVINVKSADEYLATRDAKKRLNT